MKMQIGQNGLTPLPSGRYRLTVIKVHETSWSFGPALEWVFEVADGPYSGCQVSGKMSQHNSTGPHQKLGRWYHAITGRCPTVGEEIDTDQLIGKSCWAEITKCFSKQGKPSNNVELIPEPDALAS